MQRPYKVKKDWTIGHFESVIVSFPKVVCKYGINVSESPHRDAFVKGLLSIDKSVRLGSSNDYIGFEQDIKCHPWLKNIDWVLIEQKKLQPQYRPNVCPTINIL